jgi:hypothetical protein
MSTIKMISTTALTADDEIMCVPLKSGQTVYLYVDESSYTAASSSSGAGSGWSGGATASCPGGGASSPAWAFSANVALAPSFPGR